MAYANGSTVGIQPCFDKVVETVTAAGWTLVDDLSTTDKVFKSNGESGLSHHIMRLTVDNGVTHPSPAHYQSAQPHIVFRGYHSWDATAHVGTNEFGEFGPYIYSGPGGDSGRIEIGLPNADSGLVDRYADAPEPYTNTAYHGLGVYLGERSILSAGMLNNDVLKEWDVITGEYRNLPELAVSGELSPDGAYAVVWDKDADDIYLYALHANAQTADEHFWRYSFNDNSWSPLAAPPWPTVTSMAGAFVVWDGRDTLYAGPGKNTTHFAKYSVSSNTWTLLAALPIARDTSFGQISFGQNNTFNCHQVYVPKESTGLDSDHIFIFLNSSSSAIYSYEVDTATWGTKNLVSPWATSNNRTALIFDGKETIWAINHGNTSAVYRWNTRDLDAGRITVPNFFRATNPANGAALVDPYVARIRCHETEQYGYWVFANKDRVIVATDVRGHQRWAYFGGFQSYYKGSMRLTAAASAGLDVVIAVDDTSNYIVGEKVIFVDPATGISEITTIANIVGPTSLVAHLKKSYGSGSVVGVDPLNTVAAGSMCFAVAALDMEGYYTGGQSPSYKIAPLADKAQMTRGRLSKRGQLYQPWPLVLFNTVPKWNTYENRGALDGVYAVVYSAFPAPQPGDEVLLDGKTYICFDMQELRNVPDKYRVLIGPTD